MKIFSEYKKTANKSINKSYPIELQVDTFKVDGCGDVISEEQNYLLGKYTVDYFIINNDTELYEFFSNLNINLHNNITQIS